MRLSYILHITIPLFSATYEHLVENLRGLEIELTDEELKKLKMKDPQAYRDYISDRAEEKSYEKKLQNCKTKEEAKKLLERGLELLNR